ncbi:MAG: TetR/AcrR family transcriptional regulator [Frankiales bacterium]|nr:TetR/AcrR family transcriptional regulator [Frankiales bacterium]
MSMSAMSPRDAEVEAQPAKRVGRAPAKRPRSANPTLKDAAAPLRLRDQRRLDRLHMGREQVLDAAEELFGNQGYQGTNLDQVAAGSDFSVGAVYTYYRSKRELLAGVMQRRIPELTDAIEASLSGVETGADELLRMTSAYMAFFHKYPAYGRLTMRVYSTGLEVIPDFAEYMGSYHTGIAMYAEAIERGQADGSVRAGDPLWMARMLSAMVVAHHSMTVQGGSDSDGFPTEDLLDLIRAAIRKPPARRPRAARPAPRPV